AGRGPLLDIRADTLLELLVEREAGPELHEEHDARVFRVVRRPDLADRDRLFHLVDTLDDAIDLRGADAHAAGVERGVGAAVDDHRAAFGQLGPVAVAPDVRVLVEIGRVIALAAAVVPEDERHRGKRLGADELALLADDRVAVLVEDL